MNNYFNKNKGFTIIEVLVASLIISIIMIFIMSATSKEIQLSERAMRQVQANELLEEGVEVVKIVRNNDWQTISNLSLNTNYYLSFDTNLNTWSLSTTPIEPLDEIFTRLVIFSNVFRDSDDDISSSGTEDIGTRKVEVTVSWSSFGEIVSKNIIFYITNIFS